MLCQPKLHGYRAIVVACRAMQQMCCHVVTHPNPGAVGALLHHVAVFHDVANMMQDLNTMQDCNHSTRAGGGGNM